MCRPPARKAALCRRQPCRGAASPSHRCIAARCGVVLGRRLPGPGEPRQTVLVWGEPTRSENREPSSAVRSAALLGPALTVSVFLFHRFSILEGGCWRSVLACAVLRIFATDECTSAYEWNCDSGMCVLSVNHCLRITYWIQLTDLDTENLKIEVREKILGLQLIVFLGGYPKNQVPVPVIRWH